MQVDLKTKGAEQLKGLLIGLKDYIDQEIAKGNKPMNAIAIYRDKLEKYKKLSTVAPLT